MRRILSPVFPLLVAAAMVAAASPVLRAQQNHDHASAGHACACCGHSGSGAMTHDESGGCCQSGAMAIAGADNSMMADMQVFHFLLAHRADIHRIVHVRPDGVETLTESDKPEIAQKIKAHVSAMYARLKEGRAIHQNDPLFKELFAHADQIDAVISQTANGIQVVETSTDPAVARLLQRHAEVIDAFISNGMAEMMKDHVE